MPTRFFNVLAFHLFIPKRSFYLFKRISLVKRGSDKVIKELTRENFYRCRKFAQAEMRIMEALAVINGVNPGRIFVDSCDYPSAGMIWLGNNDGFLFVGDEQNSLFLSEMNRFISESITPEAQKQGLNSFEAIPTHPKWNNTIEKMFSDRKLESWQQRVYHLEESHYRKDLEPILNDQYKVRKIDHQLLVEKDELFENHDFLSETIRQFWASTEDFLENGFGYCVVDDKRVASICYSSFVVGDTQVIGIETLTDYQQKRLAAKIAHVFVQECFKRKMTPYWDCMEENIGSWKTAESLGFHIDFDYKGYMFSFEKEL